MVSRRSFLAAGATSVLGTVAGCTDAVPLVDSSDGRQRSDAIAATESFLAAPSFAPSVDAVRDPHGATATVWSYDTSITEHAAELEIEGDLEYYGWGPLGLGEETGRTVESVDYTTVADHETNWEHDDPEGELPRRGQVKGGMASMHGSYDREAYEDAMELSSPPEFTANGVDVYYDDSYHRTQGLADDGFVETLLSGFHVPGSDLDDAQRAAAETVARRATERRTGTASPPGWVRALVDAVAQAHHFHGEYNARTDGEAEFARARGIRVDGAETTVTLAAGTSTAAAFEADAWSDGTKEASFLETVATLLGRRQAAYDGDLDSVREALIEGPSVELDDRSAVVEAVAPTEAMEELRF